MKALALLFLALMPLAVPAKAASAEFIRKANQWMASTDATKRQAAYRSWLQLGEDAMPEFEKSLKAAMKFHEGAVDRLCQDKDSLKNPYLGHEPLAAALDEERKRVMPLIKTDWKKKPGKIEMLRDDMEGLGRLHAKVVKAARTDNGPFDEAVASHFGAMVEIARQLERFEPDADSVGRDDGELRAQFVDEHIEGSHLDALRKRYNETREAAARLADAHQKNDGAGNWASGPMTAFAETLNIERDLLGLRPLLLEEKLSDAAEGHSEDMVRLGFFAHESPVPKKKTPWDRAKLAGFKGRASGENIYMGSTSPQAAYDAWFASDGHRFIMMAGGPGLLGVGIAGNHWTMMTGSR